jgi:AcrR family transcriptional regulator
MPKVSEAHLEARRNQIIEAAARCFSRDGFQATTIETICDEAELSTGAVYRYFDSKDEIITAIAEMGRQTTQDILEKAWVADNAAQSLAQMMAASLEVVHSPETGMSNRLSLLLWGEGLHTPRINELLVDALADLAQPFADEAKRGQQQGEISDSLDPAAVGRVLTALGIGYTVLAAVDHQPHTASTQAISALLTGEFTKERK